MSESDTDWSYDTPVGEENDIRPDLFTVTVKGTGVELTRTVDQTTALNVIATVLGGTASPAAAAFIPQGPTTPRVGTQRDTNDGAAANAETIDTDTTIGEYIDDCNAQQFPAKITAIGRFLELKLGQTSFTREEVKSQFRPAGEPLPGNFSRDFNDAITQRWIAEVPGEQGQYFVAKTGRAAIAANFDKSTRRAAPARRRKPTAKSDSEGSTSADNTDFKTLDDDE
jgi:hypothetical protein